MRVQTLIRFHDKREDLVREVGDEFEVTEERLGEILLAYSKPLVEVVADDKKKTDKAEIEADPEAKADEAAEVEPEAKAKAKKASEDKKAKPKK